MHGNVFPQVDSSPTFVRKSVFHAIILKFPNFVNPHLSDATPILTTV